METKTRGAASNINTATIAWHGELVQLVRLLEAEKKEFKIRVAAKVNFPQHEVGNVLVSDNKYVVEINNLGLIGHNGALPSYYKSIFANLNSSHPLARFINIFQNRIVKLHYKVWLYNEPVLRSDLSVTKMLSSVAGRRAGFNLLSYAALLRRRPLSRLAIEQILADYFSLPVRVEDFMLAQLVLAASDQTKLGALQNSLGHNTLLGEKILQRQSKCAINIGPVSLAVFKKLLPNEKMALDFAAVVRSLISKAKDIEIRLWLRPQDVPNWELNASKKMRLGYTTWCYKEKHKQMVGDVVYQI
jgi:type VI secretion system protein ImpH